MKDDKQLRKIVNICPLINADGASIVWAAKKLGIPLKERVTGIDLFENLIKLANDKGYKIYLFGAKEEVVHSFIRFYSLRSLQSFMDRNSLHVPHTPYTL